MTHQCTHCDKEFPSKSKLDRHLNSKTKCIDKISTDNAIKRSIAKFGDTYRYDKFEYKNAKTPVLLYCNTCKEYFPVLFNNHINGKGGCKVCSKVKSLNYDEFLIECKKLNNLNDKFDDETKKTYKNLSSIIKIFCIGHNDYFEINATKYLRNNGTCDICKLNELTKIKNFDLIQILIDNPNIKYKHPVYDNYESDQYGNIYKNKILINKSLHQNYYVFFIKKKRIKVHKFIYECFYPNIIIDDKIFHIDHIDQNPHNNNILNLNLLTHKEHGLKTSLQNKDRGKKANIKNSKKTIRILYNENKTEIERKEYVSISVAAKDTGTSTANILRYISTQGKIKCKNFHWIIEDFNNENIENEIWKVTKKYPKIQISNKGRIKLSNNKITYGTLSHNYMKYNNTGIHELVLNAFGNPKPDWASSVNHIDKNTKNNHIENLEWSTPKMQANHSHSIKIESYDIRSNKIIDTFLSITEASNKYSSIVRLIVNLLYSKGSISFTHPETNYGFRNINLSNRLKRRREEFRLLYNKTKHIKKEQDSLIKRNLPNRIYYIKKNNYISGYEYKVSKNNGTILCRKTHQIDSNDKTLTYEEKLAQKFNEISNYKLEWESADLIKKYWLVHKYYPIN